LIIEGESAMNVSVMVGSKEALDDAMLALRAFTSVGEPPLLRSS
jgi:hypothetical protein